MINNHDQWIKERLNGIGGRLNKPNYKGREFANGSTKRSKTFPGIAKAMAEQWTKEE